MPVYVTRAHVTIGDSKKRSSRRGPLVPKHVFQVSDIRHTPFCVRTFIVTLIGFIIVTGGIIMTIIGYKPSILLPWYNANNHTSSTNSTEPSAIPRLLGEPGPLRVLVYIGPILMGLGAFAMMVSIVLFCEIKDRYFNNIVPKTAPHQRQRSDIYDRIIEEFRKNYFRGIEVPLKSIRRRSKGRFSFSLSRSGSLMSFGRRLSQDFQKRKRERKASRESQTERVNSTKHKQRSSLRRVLADNDTWMKTSSLPNIRHKESQQCVYEMGECPCMSQTRNSQSCGPTLDQIQLNDSANGVDNPAYKDSPPGKRLRRPLTKHASLETHGTNSYLTTVVVHRESNTDHDHERPSSFLPELRCSSNRGENHSNLNDSQYSVIDIERDVELIPRLNTDNETNKSIPSLCPCSKTGTIQTQLVNTEHDICTCGSDYYCKQHALGMDSGGSSLSLSWENIPSEWNDARRNTEPIVVYKRSFTNIPQACMSDGTGSVHRTLSETSEHPIYSNQTNGQYLQACSQTGNVSTERRRSFIKGPFRTQINFFKSDTNLVKAGKYSLLRSNNCENGECGDTISLDSLNLTDDILKNFEMTETAQI